MALTHDDRGAPRTIDPTPSLLLMVSDTMSNRTFGWPDRSDVLGTSEPASQDIALLQKPFTEHDLLIRVEAALDDHLLKGGHPPHGRVADAG